MTHVFVLLEGHLEIRKDTLELLSDIMFLGAQPNQAQIQSQLSAVLHKWLSLEAGLASVYSYVSFRTFIIRC